MFCRSMFAGIMGGVFLVAGSASGQWVNFANETTTRMPTPLNDPLISTVDLQEKDYAWGDVDQDGDIDLICVRKEPFTSAGRFRNVLFMNEGIAEGHAINGVLVDRTAQFAADADDGGQGFLDETNDRDIVLTDVNGDGWLDMVTATTVSDGLPKTISHPRVYINKCMIKGVWQGFRYEEARIPQIFTMDAGGNPQFANPVAPRFCSVSAGDVTGDLLPDGVTRDGRPDLYFGDYDSSGAGGVPPPPGVDVNDRLFVNDGNGFFSDSFQTRMTATMLLSAFGMATAIVDMNNDGVMDVVKNTGLQSPTRVSISYNDNANEGIFVDFSVVYTAAPYHISVGDLNNDGLLDIVVSDDGVDRYMMNQGIVGGIATFSTLQFPNASNGFGSNSVIADLDNDGDNDVLIADVDVDISGCARRTHIFQNNGSLPTPGFAEIGQVIPNSFLTGTHDLAVFDINNDGWLDVVVGRCTGTQVWMNQPPTGACCFSNGSCSVVTLISCHSGAGVYQGDSTNCGAVACAQACPQDCASPGDGQISVTDLLSLLGQWGGIGGCDIDNNGTIDVGDLLSLLGAWGLCP